MATDLELAYAHIRGKRARYDTLWNYYDGEHPLIYSASRLAEVFKNIDASFSENWCAVVIDSVLERINLERFTVAGNDVASERLSELWLDTQLITDSYDAHLCALVTGEAAIIVGLDEDEQIEAYYNDSRMIHVEYEQARPRVIRFAAKLWQEGDAWRMTLYYPDHFEYWVAQSKEMPESYKAFRLDSSDSNPFGRINVFHIVRERRKMCSELQNIIRPQAQLNKLLADMMVAGEYGAFPQRYLISQMTPKTPLKNSPNLVWDLPAGDGMGQATQVGELSAVQLANYLTAIDRAANTIAAISRTPKHYFFQSSDAPSGEALLTMESPLVKKCTRYENRFEPTWRAVAAFILLLDGAGAFRPNDIDAVWSSAATSLPLTNAQVVETETRAGVPLRTALRRQGWSESELTQMDKDKAAEQESNANLADALLSQAQRNFDQGALTGSAARAGTV